MPRWSAYTNAASSRRYNVSPKPNLQNRTESLHVDETTMRYMQKMLCWRSLPVNVCRVAVRYRWRMPMGKDGDTVEFVLVRCLILRFCLTTVSNSYDYIMKWRSVVECNWWISVNIALMLALTIVCVCLLILRGVVIYHIDSLWPCSLVQWGVVTYRIVT